MPSPYVKKLAQDTGKSVAEIEKLWDKAKEITSDTFGKAEADFSSKEYKYTVGIIKNMLGVNENLLNPAVFMKSNKSAKDFIKETTTSANFSIGDVNPVGVSKDANDGEDDAEKMTFSDFPGTDNDDSFTEQLGVPQGSADVGKFMTDLTSDLREEEPEGTETSATVKGSSEEDIVLPPDDYYEQFM